MLPQMQSETGQKEKRIFLICNGPSSDALPVRAWPGIDGTGFRVNHWPLNDGGTFGLRCHHWFVGEHPEAWLPIVAAKTFHVGFRPTIWLPGINPDKCSEIQKQIVPFSLRIQRMFKDLPAACRWEADPRPRRPLMGSLALAVAVGMQPEELYLAGMDLYQHPSGKEYTSETKPPDHRDDFVDLYLANRHGNHNLLGDLRYIRKALDAYSGKLTCVGTVMKKRFGADYPEWNWLEG